MAILSESNLYAPYERVEKSIAQFVKEHDLSYLLGKYVEKNFWVRELRKCFSVENIDNLTDFNYARCFNYAINEGDLELFVGQREFNDHIVSKGSLNRVHVMVSALAPYVTCRLVRYDYRGGRVVMESSNSEDEWRKKVDIALAEFCKRNNLFVICDKDLKRMIEGVSLELHGPNPSVFNLLFEDGASSFPY